MTKTTNHPNRSKQADNPARNPAPAEIRAAREKAKLSQLGAAEILFCSYRTWQDWESGARRMHPVFWHYFRARAFGTKLPD